MVAGHMCQGRGHRRAGLSRESFRVSIFSSDDTLGSDGLIMVVDDNGSGTGLISECSEIDNDDSWGVAICDEETE